MGNRNMKFFLNNTAIDNASEQITGFLESNETGKSDIIRFRIMYEELLLKYKDNFGENCECSLDTDKRLGQNRLVLKITGRPLNPFETDEDAEGLINRMVAGLGLAPTWSYRDGRNCIILVIKKKRKNSTAANMAIAVVSAVILGMLTKLLPDAVQNALCLWIAEPVSNLFLRLVTALSGPIVFFSVLCGIYSIGDTATFGKIGKAMIGRFIMMTVVAVLLAMGICSFFFSLSSAEMGTVDFSALLEIILNIVPNNAFTPFTENNPLQIIFVAIVLGVAMIFLGNRTSSAARFADQFNEIVQLIMMYVSKFIPVFVFISIYTIIATDKLAVIMGVYKPLLLTMLCNGIFLVLCVVLLSLRRKVGAGLLLKKIMPVFIGGLTTASSSAVFGLNSDTCKNKLGIDKSIVEFGVPLGQVLFMPGSAGLYFVVGVSLCEMYSVSITIQKVIVLLVIAVVLAIASPPIPGGALTCYSIIITQMGVPADAIAVCVTLDVVFDFLETGVNLFSLETQLAEVAGKLDLLDTDILQSKCSEQTVRQ